MKEDTITITRVNCQSWFQIKTRNISIHIDPGYAGFYENQGIDDSIFSNKADYIVLSHNHKDHMRIDMIERLRGENTKIIAPPICEADLKTPMIALMENEKYICQDCNIIAVPAYNTLEGRSIRKFHHKGDFNGYIIEIKGKRIYFAGDTDIIDEMKEFGNLDVGLLPIGGTYVMDLEEAVRATQIMKPRVVIPMHQAEASLKDFQNKIKQLGIDCVILQIGDSFQL
ncbi:MAG: MBL fold metallo-hydrolase [Bacilli bacterium]|nr:MBL fold metallo-hydrolase [Bacilli bacterium]